MWGIKPGIQKTEETEENGVVIKSSCSDQRYLGNGMKIWNS